jgi:predicted dehydrogenase
MQKIHVGFLGAGGIAQAHAYSIEALKYYYNNVPEIILESVASARIESREKFAAKFGFKKAESVEEFAANENIEAVFILGPNKVHFEHFKLALQMPNVKYIYLEKPVCSSLEEENEMKKLLTKTDSSIKIQVGFQYLQTSSVREALNFWKSGKLGKPIHFDLKYYHGDYLQTAYREKRVTRLTPAPDGGAMADLGSHGISLLMAFLAMICGLQALCRAEVLRMYQQVPICLARFRWLTLKPGRLETCRPAGLVRARAIWFILKFMLKTVQSGIHRKTPIILNIILKEATSG